MTSLLEIINQIPNNLVHRARPILDIMILSKRLMRWNRDLELVIRDDVVPDTSVPELIVHALQPINPNDRAPNGFSDFITELGILGLESQYVKNEYAVQVLDADSDSSDAESEEMESDDDEMIDGQNEELEGDEIDDENDDENEELEIDDESNDEHEELDGENEDDTEELDGEDELEENPNVEWLQVDDGDDEEPESEDENEELESEDDVDEVEEKPNVEWLQTDDDDIYIDSAGYYKRV